MSSENVEIVRGFQSAWEGDLVEQFVAVDDPGAATGFDPEWLHPDFEAAWIAGPDYPPAPFGGRGVKGLRDGWRDWLEPWKSYRLEVEEYLDAGDKVVLLVRIKGRTKTSDVEMEHTPAAVVTLRDERLARIDYYLDRDQALEAAGLDPSAADAPA